MKRKISIIAFLVFLLYLTITVYAQGPGFDDDVADEVPLDGGITLLAAAGVGYGIKKLKERNTK